VKERLLIPGYYIEKMLAKGGMASVYLARRRETGMPVAVKIQSAELAQDRRFCTRFEANTAEQVAAILEAMHEGKPPPPIFAPLLILRLFARWWWVGAAVAAGIVAVLVI